MKWFTAWNVHNVKYTKLSRKAQGKRIRLVLKLVSCGYNRAVAASNGTC